MRTLVSIVMLCGVVALGGGCAHKDKQARGKDGKVPLNRSVMTGIASAPAPSSRASRPSATFVPAAPAPVATVTPAAAPAPLTPAPQFQPVDPSDYASSRPAYAAAAPPAAAPGRFALAPAYAPAQPAAARLPRAMAGGAHYQVKKGDTLFGIARTHYGDGARWQQIASANPGLSPGTLQAGATIVVP